jgi:hypothetical protein
MAVVIPNSFSTDRFFDLLKGENTPRFLTVDDIPNFSTLFIVLFSDNLRHNIRIFPDKKQGENTACPKRFVLLNRKYNCVMKTIRGGIFFHRVREL